MISFRSKKCHCLKDLQGYLKVEKSKFQKKALEDVSKKINDLQNMLTNTCVLYCKPTYTYIYIYTHNKHINIS